MRVAAQTPKAHAAQGPVLRDARGVEQRVAAQTQKRRFRNNAKHALSLDADAADPAFDNYWTCNATNATLQRSAVDMAALATHVSTADYACTEAYAESEGERTAEYLAWTGSLDVFGERFAAAARAAYVVCTEGAYSPSTFCASRPRV